MIEYNPDDFQRSRQREADKALAVKFFYKPRQDMAATATEGRPIFKDVLYIQISTPGNRLGDICRPMTEQDKARFLDGYNSFVNRTSVEGLDGTPLLEWTQITRSQAEELSFLKIKTVEQLASVSDVHGSQIMGFQGLRDSAKKWLETSKEQNAAQKLQAELNKRDEQIALLQAQMQTLLNGNVTPIDTAVVEVVRNKGGRPRKVVPTTQ
jgi:hypothetical protein